MTSRHALFRLWQPALSTLVLAGSASVARAQYEIQPAYPGVQFVAPTDIQPATDGTNRMFVVEKRGLIWVFEANYTTTQKTEFLDLSDAVTPKGEGGLLGLAFHPDYASNGYFFVFYVTKTPNRSIVARYTVSANPNVANPSSRVILIDSPQLDVYHNGGQLAFGADDYLYIAMGDNQVSANAQDLTNLSGSLLRIDVDPNMGPPIPFPPYAIPPDNPFARSGGGIRPEIFAYGFRNPWRFSLDPYTGEFWACDVGEDEYEEINLVTRGGNFGWPLMEGPECYSPSVCDTTDKHLKPPLYSYSHDDGIAIVGGARYHGSRLPELAGIFIFADYISGKVWGLHYDGAGTPERFDLASHEETMLALATGFDGDVLLAALDGQIYRLGRISTGVGGAPARTRLIGNFPNPFNPSTTIRFTLERAAPVRIDIVSVRGEHVRRLDLPGAQAGANDVVWRGETDVGSKVASGVYFCRLVADGIAVGAIRMVLVQ